MAGNKPQRKLEATVANVMKQPPAPRPSPFGGTPTATPAATANMEHGDIPSLRVTSWLGNFFSGADNTSNVYEYSNGDTITQGVDGQYYVTSPNGQQRLATPNEIQLLLNEAGLNSWLANNIPGAYD